MSGQPMPMMILVKITLMFINMNLPAVILQRFELHEGHL